MADLAMMEYGAGVRIVLSGDAELERAAKGKGWPIQPAFAR
jgi:phosphoserine phosphatase